MIDARPSRINYKTRKAEKKAQLVEYKGGICVDCKMSFPQVCMGFDHRDPLLKSFAIGMAMGKDISELKIEADKCDLVCANCHAIRTAGNPVIAQKISLSKTGKVTSSHPNSPETRAKMSAAAKGIPKFPESVAKSVEGRRLTRLRKLGAL